MKYLKYIKVWVLALIMVIASCDSLHDELDALNTNPNAPQEVPSEFILPSVFLNTATVVGTSVNATIMNLWVQHWGSPIYADEDQYDLRDATINLVWDRLYSRSAYDAWTIMKIGTANGDVNHVAIAMILRTHVFLVMTNIWGDIPYTEANRGADVDGGILTPVYDTQQSIYTGLFQDLDDAINMINLTQNNADIAPFDLMYGGDMSLWIKFANSLKLRMYMNLSNVEASTAQSGIAALVSAGNLIGPGEDAEFFFGTATSDGNPVSEWLNNRQDDFRVSETTINALVGGGSNVPGNLAPEDPRLTLYAAISKNDIYEGERNGKTGNFDVSKIGEFYGGPGGNRRNTMPFQFITAAEVLFIRAEAAMRGWTSENAAQLYADAVTESFNYNGMGSAAANFLTNVAPYDGTLQQLSEQKWVAMYMQGNEAYTNWRRTGWPVLQVAFDNRNTIDAIPRRWVYPTDEFSNNQTNVEVALARVGSTQNDRIYIDP